MKFFLIVTVLSGSFAAIASHTERSAAPGSWGSEYARDSARLAKVIFLAATLGLIATVIASRVR